jgi:hypothetical protein
VVLRGTSSVVQPLHDIGAALGPNEIRSYIDLVTLTQTFRSPIDQRIAKGSDMKGDDRIQGHIVSS